MPKYYSPDLIEKIRDITQESLEETADKIEAKLNTTDQSAIHILQQEANDRSRIARVVIYGFGACILLTFVPIFIGAFRSNNWHDAMLAGTDVLKSAVLPVVTLILGYYFGRASKS